MADAETVSAFRKLELETIPNEWVQSVWEADFVDLTNFPVDCEERLVQKDYLAKELTSLGSVVQSWLLRGNQDDDGQGLWSILVENEVPHKSLVALMAYLTYRAAQVSISVNERVAGILAASLYLKLVTLPGSSAFQMYNPELFLQACRLLNKWNKSDIVIGGGSGGKRKRKSLTPSKSQKSQRGKGRKRGKQVSDESSLDLGDSQDPMDEEEEDVELSGDDLRRLDKVYRKLMDDVVRLCSQFSLRQSESTASQLVGVLVTLTRMDPEQAPLDVTDWSSPTLSPTSLAYKAMALLCTPFHGHVMALATEVTKLLMNHIIMLEDGKAFTSLVAYILRMRQQAISFIKHILTLVGERYLPIIKTLIKQIAFRVPDKTDYRNFAAQSVVSLLICLPDSDYAHTLQWIKKLSKHKKVPQRSFTLDVMLLLLERPERAMSPDVPADLAEFASHRSMICVMLSRCSDVNASVRSRALGGFSSCTTSLHTDVVLTLKEVITPATTAHRPTAQRFVPTPMLTARNIADSATNESDARDPTPSTPQLARDEDPAAGEAAPPNPTTGTPQAPPTESTPQATPNNGRKSFCNIELTPSFNPYLPDTEGVLSMFRRRANDPKVIVRKFALTALQRLIQFEAPDYRKEDVDILRQRCRDPALSVRKQAVQCLAELQQVYQADLVIQKAWIFGLLPQVLDKETSVQEKCCEVLEEAILGRMRSRDRTSEEHSEWSLLNIIATEGEALRRYFQKACQHWARAKKFKPSMVGVLESHVGGPYDQAAWLMLAELSKVGVKMNIQFVVDHWKTVECGSQVDSPCDKWVDVLSTLSSVAKSMPDEVIADLQDDLKNRLHNFSFPFSLIGRMISTVSQLHNVQQSEASQQHKQSWGAKLMAECDAYLSGVILNADSTQGLDEDQLMRHMYTLGEVCQMCPTRMPKRASLLIHSIIAAPCISEMANSKDYQLTQLSQKEGSESANHSKESESANQGQPEISENQSGESSSQAQNSQQSQPSSQCSQPLSQFRGSKMSHRLRSHAFITLGKLCLVDEGLAKKTVAALARELEEAEVPAIRNNVIIVMGSLTIRYTTLVDRYITNMAACLQDPSPLVRKNTLVVLTRLLQEEYVKWKGVLFFRYITALLDEAPEIASLAEYSLVHLLLPKHPGMFFHPFIECIFHFNNYNKHHVYNKFKQTDKEKAKFTLAGRTNSSRRLKLYAFMLEHMSDEHRFKITDKLNKEIVAATVDTILPFDDEGAVLLQDALAILSSKEIKLSTLKTKAVDDAGEEPDMAQVVQATARKVLITQVVRRNVMENIVPVVISLKHMLEKKRSPLLKHLMGYLREIMKDYKTEVKDILAADKQLAEEIEFDLRNFETQQAEREARDKQGSRPATPIITSRPSTPGGSRLSSRPQSPTSTRPSSPLVMTERPESPLARPALRETGGNEGDTGAHRRASVQLVTAAKRAMSRVDQLRASPNSPLRRKGTSNSALKKNGPIQSIQSRFNRLSSEESDENSPGLSTPVRRDADPSRAISTPTDALYNITFGGEGNVTVCPPSPIPSVASAMNGGQLCLSPNVRILRKGNKDVLQMPHPNAKDPQPTKWNIQSPEVTTPDPMTSEPQAGATPTRKSFTQSRAGMRRSSRQRNT